MKSMLVQVRQADPLHYDAKSWGWCMPFGSTRVILSLLSNAQDLRMTFLAQCLQVALLALRRPGQMR